MLAPILQGLIIAPESEAVLTLVRSHRAVLVTDPALATLAVIALRRSGHPEVAIALADRVLLTFTTHRRLAFERAVSAWIIRDCHDAMPRFERLAAARADDLIGRESRLFLASCEAMQGWRGDMVSSAGYDDNLAGTRPQRDVRAEPGSVYHTLLESLEPFIDLPETLALGSKPVGGFWVAGHPGLVRHWGHDDGVDSLRLGVDGRIANRRFYERWRGRIDFIRQRQHGAISTRLGLRVTHGHSRIGPDRPHRITSSIETTARLGLELPRHLTVAMTLIGAYEESSAHRPSRLRANDLRLGLAHQGSRDHGLSGLGWRFYWQGGEDKADPPGQSGQRSRFGVGIGPLPLTGSMTISADASREMKAYDDARPWLATPHEDRTRHLEISVTYPLSKDRSLLFRINHAETRSPDPLDNTRRWQFLMIFEH